MRDSNPIHQRDLHLADLVPRSKRAVDQAYYHRLEASLKAIGLMEHLLVCDRGDHYEILDGNLRYQILLDMGVTTVPCLLVKEAHHHE